MGLADTHIPSDKLPQCWSDDVRMNALFAPFRIKSANPESWDMKMKFWSDMVRQWCRHKSDPVISAADIKNAFQRKGRTAACIDIVVEEMFRNGDLSPISKYLQILYNGQEGWVSWSARMAFKPAVFAVSTVLSMLPARQQLDSDSLPKASIECTQRFVLESAVKDQATKFLEGFPSGEQRVGTIDELIRNSQWAGSRETLEILLGYLVSQGAAVKKGEVVKLAEPNKKATAVTESDEALARLSSAEARLEADLSRLEREMEAASADAKAALKLGNKIAAKNHLRRKHKIMSRAQRCEAALDNVRQLLQQMSDVQGNVAIVDTFRTSSEAMKRTMKEGRLNEDSVFDTMDELRDVLETYNEVEKVLGTTLEDVDAAELEEELKDLLNTPTAPGGGTPGKEERRDGAAKIPSPSQARTGRRKESEREFVFDGEERMLAELNKLSVEDATPKKVDQRPAKPELVAEVCAEVDKVSVSTKPNKPWYPPQESWPPKEVDASLQLLGDSYSELRMDDRLHPGQKLQMDLSSPPRLYSGDFQVRDHKMAAPGVWLYNSRDGQETALAASTEYISSESPGKTGGAFEMAPGGERIGRGDEDRKVDDLERRLYKLRGFRL